MSETRVLVIGAGTGAANNLIRSLTLADTSLVVLGSNDDRFILKQSLATRNYLIPSVTHPEFLRSVQRVVRAEHVDLVVPTGDREVTALSHLRNQLSCRVFLPRHFVIERCQDKYALTRFLRSRGIRAPLTYAVGESVRLTTTFRRLATTQPLVWCRLRRGNGSLGAIPVRTIEQASSWIRYWGDMRGIPATAFTLSEYLPGRDFGCQSLWKVGRLVLIKTFERLSYVVHGSQAGAVSSLAALTKTVVEPRVVETCTAAIRSLDRRVSGVFCVDLKEDARGVPAITEINAGRFSMSTSIYDFTGAHSMALTYVQLALGRRVACGEPYDTVDDYYMVRDLDGPPAVLRADAFFDGIIDARMALQDDTPSTPRHQEEHSWLTSSPLRRVKRERSFSVPKGRVARPSNGRLSARYSDFWPQIRRSWSATERGKGKDARPAGGETRRHQ